jgi:esterase/lipase
METDLTFYSIEYPSYGQYPSLSAALISNTIKEDALNFYQFLKLEMGKGDEDIFVMGRSIGSGGASYLAGNRSVPLLILMSPFDTIKKVSKGIIGCLGGIVKQHFNN